MYSLVLAEANIQELGWAPLAGFKAMEELKNLEEEQWAAVGMSGHFPVVPKGVASDEMCVFLILNISSLQLIFMNVSSSLLMDIEIEKVA